MKNSADDTKGTEGVAKRFYWFIIVMNALYILLFFLLMKSFT